MTTLAQDHSNWTAPGSDSAAQATYASVRLALADVIKQRDVEVFLQGSYANHTNVRADSDVDIVVMTRQTFSGNPEGLTPTGRLQWDGLSQATFFADDLRSEVHAALASYYGASRVHPRNKCITVDKTSGYVDADVVPCIQYRHFRNSYSTSQFVEGIKIHPLNGGSIVNFPKEHIRNGEEKNRVCSSRYKPTVRQLKRLRNRAISEGRLVEGDGSGYLLECMAFNAPTDRFVYDDSQRLSSVLLWMKYADKSAFQACDGIHYLFRDDPGGFLLSEAQRVLDAMWDAF